MGPRDAWVLRIQEGQCPQGLLLCSDITWMLASSFDDGESFAVYMVCHILLNGFCFVLVSTYNYRLLQPQAWMNSIASFHYGN